MPHLDVIMPLVIVLSIVGMIAFILWMSGDASSDAPSRPAPPAPAAVPQPVGPRPGDQVCRQCGTVGQPITGTGPTAIAAFFGFLCGIIPGFIVLILADRAYPKCPACSAVKTMIPAGTPEGRRIMSTNRATE